MFLVIIALSYGCSESDLKSVDASVTVSDTGTPDALCDYAGTGEHNCLGILIDHDCSGLCVSVNCCYFDAVVAIECDEGCPDAGP